MTSGFVAGALLAGLALGLAGVATDGKTPQSKPRATSAAAAQAVYAKLPLAFEATGHRGRYLARGSGYSLWTTATGTVLSLDRGGHAAPAIVRTRLAGARPARAIAERRLPGVVNIYRGRRSQWQSGLKTYRQVRYASVYPGIDAVYHGRQGQLEYDFEVAPGGNAARIGMALSGAKRVAVSKEGDLQIDVAGGRLVQERPVAYQLAGGDRVPVAASYRVTEGRVGFIVGSYDRSRPLVIDPVLSYSSYLGGSLEDRPQGIELGPDGSPYITGYTKSNNFPGATARTVTRTDFDAFVTRLDRTGATVLFSTYIGGAGATDDRAHALTISGGSSAYVVGQTSSSDFPQVAPLPADQVDTCADAGANAFLARLSSSGVLGYSTCIGGNGTDSAQGVATRSVIVSGAVRTSRQEVFISGSTSSTSGFPTPGGFQTASTAGGDAFLVKVNFTSSSTCDSGPISPPCDTIPYGTYFGGDGSDVASAVAIDTGGNAYLTGSSGSTFLNNVGTPTSPFSHAYVVKFNPATTGSGSLSYFTWYGGPNGQTGEVSYGIAVSSASEAYIVGDTDSDMPSVDVSGYGGGRDAFIGKVSAGGSPVKTLELGGGTNLDSLRDVALQENGGVVSVYAVGESNSAMTAINGLEGQSCAATSKQVLIVKAVPSATPYAVYRSCLGGTSTNQDAGTGIAVGAGPDGTAWITGDTGAFPTVGPLQGTYGGGSSDGFVAKIAPKVPVIDSGPSGVIGTNTAQFTFSSSDTSMQFECSTPSGGTLVAALRSTSSCTGAGSASYSNLADGPQTLGVATVDLGGSKSAPATRDFTVDTTPPGAFDLTAPDNGAETSTQPTFSWTTPADATTLTYQIMIDGQKLQDVSDSACTGGTCTAQAASIIPGGGHTWNVVALDGATPANKTTSTSTRSITVVDPPVAHFAAAPNPALVGRSVSFDGRTSAPGTHPIAKYEWDLDGDGTYETDTGGTPTTAKTYDTAGTINTGLRVTDTIGQTGTTTVPLRISDLPVVGGQVGVSINKGAQYTNKPDVTLTIVAPPSATSLLVANDGGFAAGLPSPVVKDLSWKLDSSGPERLPKTVYLRFLTATFASPNYTDDIILDERPPVVNSASVVGGAGSARIARLKTYTVKVQAKDSNSGVGFVQVTANKKKPGKLIKYKTKVKAKLASRPKFLRARDRAGNYSKWKKLR